MSRLLDFYRGKSPDSEGRFLKDLLAWSDLDLEEVHDFIQWLFPLPEPSRFNPDAPLLTSEDIAAFNHDERLRANLAKSFERILSFLGLEGIKDAGAFIQAEEVQASKNARNAQPVMIGVAPDLAGAGGMVRAGRHLAVSASCRSPSNNGGRPELTVRAGVTTSVLPESPAAY
jgi:hypothetical protein